jgi:AcrR family transcriptional regulator
MRTANDVRLEKRVSVVSEPLPQDRRTSRRRAAKQDVPTVNARPGSHEDGQASILEAAALVFRQKGYASASIDDIADVLGSTKGRIYHYFRSKLDIALGIHTTALLSMIDRVTRARDSAADPAGKLEAMVREHLTIVLEHRPIISIGAQGDELRTGLTSSEQRRAIEAIYRLRGKYETMFIDVLAEGVSTGAFRSLDPRFGAKALLGSLNWITIWHKPNGGGNGQEPEITDEFTRFIARAVER